jgi:diguanylate cyclase (GGDEF)-like protein
MAVEQEKRKLCLLVCENYLTELNEVVRQEEFPEVTIKPYPQVCLTRKIPESVKDLVLEDGILPKDHVFMSDYCLLKKAIEKDHSTVEDAPSDYDARVPGHCLQMIVNREEIDNLTQNGEYIVTPGWLVNWQRNLETWGFDRQSARQFFEESTTGIVLLETYSRPETLKRLSDFAEYVGLHHRVLPTGLTHFRRRVDKKISNWHVRKVDELAVESIDRLQKQIANYAMAFDLLSNLTRMMKEYDAIQEIRNLFNMMFAAQEMTYISLNDHNPDTVFPDQTPKDRVTEILAWANTRSSDYQFINENHGFLLRISHQSSALGVIEVRQFAHPEYAQEYLNMSLMLAPLFGLVISNARAYQKIEEKEALLQKLASNDPLTGLHNRRYFMDVAEVEFRRAKRYDRPLSVISIDIDLFKIINDTYGHAAGDIVLVELSRILETETRDADIPVRMGGEEFVIMLPETGLPLAETLAERLRLKVANMVVYYEGTPMKITISLGIAYLEKSFSCLQEFLQKSDQALYQAKHNGRNQVAIYRENA